jgi:hypothetical protein
MFNNFGIQVSNNLTITGVALEHFLTNHLKNKKIALINNKKVYREIKKSYYGGLSDVYIPYGENLNYYDVNSLYPYAALNTMPGDKCTYIEDLSGDGLNLDTIFGYFYCRIKTTNDYLGLLPRRHNGLLVHPNGK